MPRSGPPRGRLSDSYTAVLCRTGDVQASVSAESLQPEQSECSAGRSEAARTRLQGQQQLGPALLGQRRHSRRGLQGISASGTRGRASEFRHSHLDCSNEGVKIHNLVVPTVHYDVRLRGRTATTLRNLIDHHYTTSYC
eukprot:952-Pleurochrysis_carterae.AAC.3